MKFEDEAEESIFRAKPSYRDTVDGSEKITRVYGDKPEDNSDLTEDYIVSLLNCLRTRYR